MSEEYIDIKKPINKIVEMKEYEQKTPRRIITEYQTTGIFKNIGKKVYKQDGKVVTR